MPQQNNGVFGGSLLIAGTTLGGGMLALPVLTGLGGFVPSIVIFFFCWIFMASTGLLFLELSLIMPKESNLISMAKYTLGRGGEAISWIFYLFLFYSLTLAYVVGCGNLVVDLIDYSLPTWVGSLLFVGIFGSLVLMGARLVDKINVLLMFGLAVSFFAFVGIGYPFINTRLLENHTWSLSFLALPIAFTSFAYQGIIPTLVNYMQHDAKKIRLSIIIGSFIPLLVYTIWQGLILGIVPIDGSHGLVETLNEGQNAVHPLKYFIQNASVYTIGTYFAFFALVTSFFGVVLGLVDFLADGFKISKTPRNKILLGILVYAPPLIIAFSHPDVFLTALDYAGGIGCAVLLGLMPILMVWSLRYRLKIESSYQLPGGKIFLLLLLMFVLFELAWEVHHILSKI